MEKQEVFYGRLQVLSNSFLTFGLVGASVCLLRIYYIYNICQSKEGWVYTEVNITWLPRELKRTHGNPQHSNTLNSQRLFYSFVLMEFPGTLVHVRFLGLGLIGDGWWASECFPRAINIIGYFFCFYFVLLHVCALLPASLFVSSVNYPLDRHEDILFKAVIGYLILLINAYWVVYLTFCFILYLLMFTFYSFVVFHHVFIHS